MDPLQSSQSFVRALKALSSAGNPPKIEIARQAWDNTVFYVPSKGEFITDWILSSLLKERTNHPEANPLLDIRFWSLLADIISPRDPIPSTHPAKIWLIPLLSRISVSPITFSFLSLLSSLDDQRQQELTPTVSRCLGVIWPLAAHKFGFDALSGCFSAILGVFKLCHKDESLARIGLMITSSFQTLLSNISHKKKSCLTFWHSHLPAWFECISNQTGSHGAYHDLLEGAYSAGVESIFSLDILRQDRAFKSDIALFDILESLTQASPLVAPSILPRLFASFIQRIRRYRSVLYNHIQISSDTEELCVDAMDFFASCDQLLGKIGACDNIWSARLALLSVVEKENLFSVRQSEAGPSLKRVGELAISALDHSWETGSTRTTTFAIDILSTLTRIDYDLVSQVIPNILPKLLLVTEVNSPAFGFLDLLLDYHIKTHTMPVYIFSLLTAVSQSFATPQGPQYVYQISSSGPLLLSSHLERLGKCVHRFLTSHQTVEIIHHSLQKVQQDWEQFYTLDSKVSFDNQDRSRKRRKPEANTNRLENPEDLAVSLSLSIRFVSIVLSSLPVHSTSDPMRHQVFSLLNEAETAFIQVSLNETLEVVQNGCSSDTWAAQIATTAILRLWCALNRALKSPLRISDSRLLARFISIIKNDTILPELHFELFHVLLSSCAGGHVDGSELIINNLVEYLGRNLTTSNVSWSGMPCQLTSGESGRKKTALALLQALCEKWLPVLDGLASKQQLELLVKLMISIRPSTNLLVRELCASACFTQALRSAYLWELPNLRLAFISLFDTQTSSLDGVDTTKSLTLKERRASPIPSEELKRAVLTYDILLFAPIEYLPRTLRADLVRRAVSADVLSSSVEVDHAELNIHRSLTILRIFLQRVILYTGSADHLSEYLEYLLDPKGDLSQPTPEYMEATLDLIEVHFLTLMKAGTNALTMLKIIRSFSCPYFLASLSETEPRRHQVKKLALIRFIDLMTRVHPPPDFSEENRASMIRLQECLLTTSLSHMMTLTFERTSLEMVLIQHQFLDVWYHALLFGRWLELSSTAPRVGHHLISKISSFYGSHSTSACTDPRLKDTGVAVLAILFEEFYHLPENDRLSHLETVFAACVSFSQICGSDGRKKLEFHLSKSCKFVTASEFSHVLDLIMAALSNINESSESLSSLLQMLTLLLHEAPQNTLKFLQASATRCFNLFTNRYVFTSGPIYLHLGVLKFIAEHCSDRPAALRAIDIGSILSLVSKTLAGAHNHDEKTSTVVFHQLVTIIGSLIRLRRDLVIHTLPHLCMVLRQLISMVRHLRPQLGAKQSRLVTDTLPKWINANDPLTPEEVKALTRLLEALSAKTVPKNHSFSVGNQKAESLAKAFSRYAPSVLLAYIDAMNDPLGIIPFELRKELQPGLFSLCDMLNEHSRDSLMVSSLDPGRKATLKSLWREYEKQKYIGKG